MTQKEQAAMQQALEALENCEEKLSYYGTGRKKGAITALREALGNSLKRKCFADYQPNHAIHRACASCAIADECRTGEQPVSQEPVGYVDEALRIKWLIDNDTKSKLIGHKLYTAPQPVKEVELTDDEIYTLYSEPCSDREMVEFARAVIAADREKNCG